MRVDRNKRWYTRRGFSVRISFVLIRVPEPYKMGEVFEVSFSGRMGLSIDLSYRRNDHERIGYFLNCIFDVRSTWKKIW